MNKTVTLVPTIAGLMLMAASAAQAQTLRPQSETGAYVTVSAGGQPQTRSFGSGGTFSTFNETGRYEVIQNVGAGVLFDVGGGYKFAKHLGAGLSVWNTRSKSAAAAAASIPDPLFFGRFTTVTPTAVDQLKQSTVGVNLFVTYTTPIADRFDLAVSLGPSLIKTKLDAASATVAANGQTVTITTDSQSKSTAKAGNFTLDFTYRLSSTYSVGVFGRYAGGELDLPAVKKLKVGTAQAGGLIRYRF